MVMHPAAPGRLPPSLGGPVPPAAPPPAHISFISTDADTLAGPLEARDERVEDDFPFNVHRAPLTMGSMQDAAFSEKNR